MNQSFPPRRRALCRIFAVCLLPLPWLAVAEQQTSWKAGKSSDTQWSTLGNWSGTMEPTAGSKVHLPGLSDSSRMVTITLGSNEVANSLAVHGAYELNGGSLTLAAGGIDVPSGGRLIVDSALKSEKGNGLVKTGEGILNLMSGSLPESLVHVDGGIVNVGGKQSKPGCGWSLLGRNPAQAQPQNRNAATVNFQSGSSTLVASGKGVEIGHRDFVGGFAPQNVHVFGNVENAGALRIGRAGTLNILCGGTWVQSGAVVLASRGGGKASMNVNAAGSFAYTGSAPFQLGASGSTVANDVTIDEGVFVTGAPFHNAGVSGVSTLLLTNGGTLRCSANLAALSTTSGAETRIQVGFSGGIIDTQSYDVGIPVAVIGTGGALTKLGDGTLTLSGKNAFNGKTLVNEGALRVTGDMKGEVIVNHFSTLSGSGAVGHVTVNGTGILAPGNANAIGQISTGDLTLKSSSVFKARIDQSGTDSVYATGKVTMEGVVTLHISLLESPAKAGIWTLLKAGAGIYGISNGARFAYAGNVLEEGETFTVTSGGISRPFKISYQANNRQDVVLMMP